MELQELQRTVRRVADGHQIIMATRFGSHLYGTDTPASDTDIKGIFMPTKSEVLLAAMMDGKIIFNETEKLVD